MMQVVAKSRQKIPVHPDIPQALQSSRREELGNGTQAMG